jgi:hypothetical protein
VERNPAQASMKSPARNLRAEIATRPVAKAAAAHHPNWNQSSNQTMVQTNLKKTAR